MSAISDKLKQLGLRLPNAASPAANYVPWKIEGNVLYISGQIPFLDGETAHIGHLGADLGISDGQAAARACALNILAHLNSAIQGDLSRVRSCISLGGFVNSDIHFDQQPAVINGASDLMVAVLGEEKGRHTRFAVGVANLPFGVAVEIDARFALEPA